MNEDRMNPAYFEWMYRLVFKESRQWRRSWYKLLGLLHSTEFIFTIDLDTNRAHDGVDLRRRFEYEEGLPVYQIGSDLYPEPPCSVLEMMIALAIRVEESLMGDDDYGDRTSKWFWKMLKSLGLADQYDSAFNEYRASSIIFRFLRREYQPDGQGGLYTIPNCKYDLRTIEIWYQAMWYLDDFIQRSGHDRFFDDFDSLH